MRIETREALIADICRMSRFIKKALEMKNDFFETWLKPYLTNNPAIYDQALAFSMMLGKLLIQHNIVNKYESALKPLLFSSPIIEVRNHCRESLSRFFESAPEIEEFLKNNLFRIHDAFDKICEIDDAFTAPQERSLDKKYAGAFFAPLHEISRTISSENLSAIEEEEEEETEPKSSIHK